MGNLFQDQFGYKPKSPPQTIQQIAPAPLKITRTLGDMATMANIQAKYDPSMPQSGSSGGQNADVVKSPPQAVAQQGTAPAMQPTPQPWTK